MISFTRMVTEKVDEESIFYKVKDFLIDDICIEDLPKDVQRLIFAKVGAMMIDYAGSEEF